MREVPLYGRGALLQRISSDVHKFTALLTSASLPPNAAT